jgi:hypothetical protein
MFDIDNFICEDCELYQLSTHKYMGSAMCFHMAKWIQRDDPICEGFVRYRFKKSNRLDRAEGREREGKK